MKILFQFNLKHIDVEIGRSFYTILLGKFQKFHNYKSGVCPIKILFDALKKLVNFVHKASLAKYHLRHRAQSTI